MQTKKKTKTKKRKRRKRNQKQKEETSTCYPSKLLTFNKRKKSRSLTYTKNYLSADLITALLSSSQL